MSSSIALLSLTLFFLAGGIAILGIALYITLGIILKVLLP